jgi:hypothetical protein
MRMDASNQTVFLDAAFTPLYTNSEAESARAVLRKFQEAVITIIAQDEEQRFWKHLLPTFAELSFVEPQGKLLSVRCSSRRETCADSFTN